MSEFEFRAMQESDWDEVAELIYASTNAWYQSHGCPPIFTGEPNSTRLFCEVYEDLDPGCCILAVNHSNGVIGGSCFYHPRPTHYSLGIMNVHPDHFGKGIGRALLGFVIETADQARKPVRLVSSALNLDSYSLYNRAGFVPRATFQDMFLTVPENGLPLDELPPGLERVRDAKLDDLPSIIELEAEVHHIERPDDFRYFLENKNGIWHVSVLVSRDGNRLDGFIVSVNHPASRMIGPGAMRTQTDAAALMWFELDQHRGGTPVWLAPVEAGDLIDQLYQWGARNCEIHLSQVRGAWERPQGIVMPTFMPETC